MLEAIIAYQLLGALAIGCFFYLCGKEKDESEK